MNNDKFSRRDFMRNTSLVAAGTIATIDQQLKVVEEAINAIDQYRQQVNQQLIELRDAARDAPASGG